MPGHAIPHLQERQNLYVVVTLKENTHACRMQFLREVSTYIRGDVGDILAIHEAHALLWLSRVAGLWDDYAALYRARSVQHTQIVYTKAEVEPFMKSFPPRFPTGAYASLREEAFFFH